MDMLSALNLAGTSLSTKVGNSLHTQFTLGEWDARRKRQENVYAGRHGWEASDRPWHPFEMHHLRVHLITLNGALAV